MAGLRAAGFTWPATRLHAYSQEARADPGPERPSPGAFRAADRVLGEDVFLELDLAEEPVTVRADAAQVRQIVVNLAVNARDAMPAGEP